MSVKGKAGDINHDGVTKVECMNCRVLMPATDPRRISSSLLVVEITPYKYFKRIHFWRFSHPHGKIFKPKRAASPPALQARNRRLGSWG